MKKWYQSKTMWTNLGLAIGGLGTVFTTSDPQAQGAGMTASVTGIVNLLLRLITKTGIR